MKKKKAMLGMIIVLALLVVPALMATAATAKTRTANGVYYNYMVVECEGKDWLLSDKQSSSNPYMKWNSSKKCYMPIFKNKQKVVVTFNTKGTASKKDDTIKSVVIK